MHRATQNAYGSPTTLRSPFDSNSHKRRRLWASKPAYHPKLLFTSRTHAVTRHHLRAAVWTGSSQKAVNLSSSSATVIEQPAISSEVTKEPTSERATVSPRFSRMRLTALYMR